MPIVEAQTIGVPVITSDIAPMKNIAGLGAQLADPFNIGSIRNAIVAILNDDKLRDSLVAKEFENSQRFSADTAARKDAELLQES